jgi:pimeloyl-ACP methyl ester carboxylesterase
MRVTIDNQDGSLACELFGEGKLCICAHGFPDCERSFREQLHALVGAGLRVALPTMRGYAPSGPSRSGRYHAQALGRDLLAIADALSPDQPVVVVGHDWGAIAGYAAAALAPARIDRLVTMAVPHLRLAMRRWLAPRQLYRSRYIGLFQLRGAAERRLDGAYIQALWREWSPGYRLSEAEQQRVNRAVLAHPSAVLGYYREILDAASRRLLFARTSIPALYLHGADDGCVGVELTREVERGYTAGVSVRIVEGAGHFVHLERPDVVNRHLVEFLSA